MSKISNSFFMRFIMRAIILFAVAKSISLVLFWYLPKEGVTQNSNKNYVAMYQKVDFKTMLQSTKKGSVAGIKSIDSRAGKGITIAHLILKAIYATQKKGFVVVAKKANPLQTSIVALGEQYEGFTLNSILKQSAIFYKNNEEYVLELEAANPNKQRVIKGEKNGDTQHVDKVDVSKEDLSFYTKNPEEIWKEISIAELKEGEEIRGFEVKDVKKGSKFESLGLKKGDVIVKVNNVVLKSYKDAIDIYQNVGDISGIALIVLRDNQEVELVYEVN
ncbi:MAG: PDZ domain-containing protein [Sulfurimonas sp.]|uniref:PDZ domain-containing protein n=1 Tax=Sulfurimonas sp. TaxID=2022749 RepID=UPI003D0ED751